MCKDIMETFLKESAEKHCSYEVQKNERNAGNHTKRTTTLFGEISPIKRPYYYNSETKKGHYPFDDRLGLCGRYTPALVQEVVRHATKDPYKEASQDFVHHYGFNISDDTIHRIVGKYGGLADDYTRLSDTGPKEDEDGKIPIVVVSGDGTGTPMRKEELKNTKGKNGEARTREVKAGSVFIASKTSENEPHRNDESTTYVATTERTDAYGKLLRTEFDRRFKHRPEVTLYITDGAKWLRTVHDNHFPFAIEILDFYHAMEHLKPLMIGLGYKEETEEWKKKYAYWKKRIKEGKIEGILESLWKNHGNRLNGEAMREYKYFRSNKDRMKYNEYRAKGWFIGSGVVESACKTVVGKRFKQPGMFWSLKGADALLPLRTLSKSGRLKEFFDYILKDLPQVIPAA